jgi:hypothetical protein
VRGGIFSRRKKTATARSNSRRAGNETRVVGKCRKLIDCVLCSVPKGFVKDRGLQRRQRERLTVGVEDAGCCGIEGKAESRKRTAAVFNSNE